MTYIVKRLDGKADDLNKKKQRPSISVEQVLAEQLQGAKLHSAYDEDELDFAIISHVTDLQIRPNTPLPELAKGMEMPRASVAQMELRGGVMNLDYRQCIAV